MKTAAGIAHGREGILHFQRVAGDLTGPALILVALALNPAGALAGEAPPPVEASPSATLDATHSLLQHFEAQGKPLQPKKGDRTIGKAAAEEAKPAEWFNGERPWHQWSRVTGNWGGLRDALENGGATIAGTYTMDWGGPIAGGISKRGTIRGLLDVNLTVDAGKLGLPGGTFFAQYYFRHGRNGSDDVGDIQAFSNIDEARLSREYELWYEQKILNDKLRVKVGQVDANSEFAFVEAAGEAIHSSAGFSPAIFPFPTYPDPALSVNVFVYPTENTYLGTGIYGDRIADTSDNGFREPFYLAEFGVTLDLDEKARPLRLAAGVYYDTGRQDRFDGGTQNKGNGFYALAEQQVWREHPDDKEDTQGLSVFAQYGFGDDKVSAVRHHIGLGLSAVGLIPARDADVTGLYWTLAKTSRATGSGFDADESAFEFYYKFEVTPAISLKPDLQYITNPGGVKTADDALVFTLRLDVTL